MSLRTVLAFYSTLASYPSSTWTHSCQGDPNRSLHKVTILCSEPAAISRSLPYIKCLIQWCLAYSSTSWKDLENNKMLPPSCYKCCMDSLNPVTVCFYLKCRHISVLSHTMQGMNTSYFYKPIHWDRVHESDTNCHDLGKSQGRRELEKDRGLAEGYV